MKATVLTEAYIQQIIEEETRSILFEEQNQYLLKEGKEISYRGICAISVQIDDILTPTGRLLLEDILGTIVGILFPGPGDVLDAVLAVRSYCRRSCIDAVIGFVQAIPLLGLAPVVIKLSRKSGLLSVGPIEAIKRFLKLSEKKKLTPQEKQLRDQLFKDIKEALKELAKDVPKFRKTVKDLDDDITGAQLKILNLMTMGDKKLQKAMKVYGFEDGRVASFLKYVTSPFKGVVGNIPLHVLSLARWQTQALLAILNVVAYLLPAAVNSDSPEQLAQLMQNEGITATNLDEYVCRILDKVTISLPTFGLEYSKELVPMDYRAKELEKIAVLKSVPKEEQTPLQTYRELAQEWGYGSVTELLIGLQDPRTKFRIDHTRINRANVEDIFTSEGIFEAPGIGSDFEKIYYDYQTTSIKRGFHHKKSDIAKTPEEVKQIILKAREGIQ